MVELKEVVKSGLCLGCGICIGNGYVKSMIYSEKKGQFFPDLSNDSYRFDKSDIEVCPGNGYKIVNSAIDLFPNTKYQLETGHYLNQYAVHSNNDKILQNATSGGIITEILIYLLRIKFVDYVTITKFSYGSNGVNTTTFLSNKKEEIIEAQGSKYCPVNMENLFHQLDSISGRVAFVGTPCQISGIRQLQLGGKYKNIVFQISNFCGGFKSFNNIEKISKYLGISNKNIEYFRFRGKGQPGSLQIRDSLGNNVSVQYPKYTGFTGYSKHLRCHLCIDATGELADISCGDAWSDRFLKDKMPWSFVLARSHFAEKLLNEMINSEVITSKDVKIEEVVNSQKTNIISKKVRQNARIRLYTILGYKIPKFDGGSFTTKTSIFLELKIFINHKLFSVLETLDLYRPLWKFWESIKKKRKK